ncbi:MAG: tetratricopeptide repeat protein [bacterium]
MTRRSVWKLDAMPLILYHEVRLPDGDEFHSVPGSYIAIVIMALLGLLQLLTPVTASAARRDEGAHIRAELGAIDSLLTVSALEPALDRTSTLLRAFPDDPLYSWQINERLGLALHRLGRSADAIPYLETAILIAPQEASCHLNLAAALMALGQRGRAFAEYDEATSLDPSSWRAHLDYGQVLHAYRMTEEARHHLQLADQLCPDCPEVTRVLAWFHLDNLEYGLAIGPLEKLHTAEPSGELRHNLALSLLSTQQPARARELLEPLWPSQLSAAESLLLLEALQVLGESHRIRGLITEVEDDSPVAGEPLFWGRAAFLCLEAGQNEAGLLAIDRAIALAPEQVAYRNNRVVLLTRLERHDEAAAEWGRVIELDPGLASEKD